MDLFNNMPTENVHDIFIFITGGIVIMMKKITFKITHNASTKSVNIMPPGKYKYS